MKSRATDGVRKFLENKQRLATMESMNCHPVDLALQHVSETKHLIDALITSSESFDYSKAKLALKALEKKSRELARVRSELLAEATAVAPANVVPLTMR
jgi:hypothetical protein